MNLPHSLHALCGSPVGTSPNWAPTKFMVLVYVMIFVSALKRDTHHGLMGPLQAVIIQTREYLRICRRAGYYPTRTFLHTDDTVMRDLRKLGVAQS